MNLIKFDIQTETNGIILRVKKIHQNFVNFLNQPIKILKTNILIYTSFFKIFLLKYKYKLNILKNFKINNENNNMKIFEKG